MFAITLAVRPLSALITVDIAADWCCVLLTLIMNRCRHAVPCACSSLYLQRNVG